MPPSAAAGLFCRRRVHVNNTFSNMPVEPAEVPGERAYGYLGLRNEVRAESGAHAATLAVEDPEIIEAFQARYREGGIDRWRSLGCGKQMPSENQFPDRPGTYVVDVIERRLFHKTGGRVKQKGDPIRFARSVKLKDPA